VIAKKTLRGFCLVIVLSVMGFFVFVVGIIVFSIYFNPNPPKHVKNRAEWIRLYKIFNTEFPEPIKEEKIVKCETYFLDLLIFDEKAKPKLEKLTSNWLYIRNNKITDNLDRKIQDDIKTVLYHVKTFSLGKKKLPDDLKPLFFDENGKEDDESILNEKLVQNMLFEMKEGYKFYRYYRKGKRVFGELSLYFVYIPKINHLYVYNDTFYTERIDYIKEALQ
jgi:hypothetical protein